MSLLNDVSIMITPNGVKEDVLFGVLPTPTEGSELVTNGNFATDSDWNKETGWTISGGTANFSGSGSGNRHIDQSITLTDGKTYKLQFEVTAISSGTVACRFSGMTGIGEIKATQTGTYTGYITANSSATGVLIEDDNNSFVGSIDNVSVKEYTTSDMAFTRATTATRLDSSGDIVNVATGVPRLDYTGASCPHILVEPARTNTLTVSEPASGGSNVTFKTDFNALGFTNCIFFDGDKSVDRYFYQHGVPASTEMTLSFFVKMEDGSEPVIGVDNNTGDFVIIISGLTATPNASVYMGNNVWRVSGTKTTGTGFLSNNGIIKFDNSGVSSKAFRVVGLQAEAGSYATSYIPTTGSTVTRNEELFTRKGISSLIDSSKGVLFAEIEALADDGTTRQISLSDGTANNRVTIGFNSTSNFAVGQVRSGGSFSMNKTPSITQTNNNKIALKWKVNDMAIWLNGSEVSTDNSGAAPIGLDRLTFDKGDGSNDFFGKIKQLQVYKEALTDDQLAALTT